MLRKEFDAKYKMVSIENEQKQWLYIDVFVIDFIMIEMLFAVLVWWQTFLVAAIGAIVIGVLIGILYWYERRRRHNKFLSLNAFLDLGIFCGDGIIYYQYEVDEYGWLKNDEWICVNDEFILDTTALFPDGYNIHEDIFSFVDDSLVLTKYGVGKAPCVVIMTTYEGEYELDEKIIPVLMIRLTGPAAMKLSK